MNVAQIEKNSDWHDVMWGILTRVRDYTDGGIGWISIQDSDEFDDLFGFTITDIPGREQGNRAGFACIRLVDARTADDTVIRDLATQVLGYAPDSPEDLKTRKAAAEYAMKAIQERIDHEQLNLQYYQVRLEEIQRKMEALVT